MKSAAFILTERKTGYNILLTDCFVWDLEEVYVDEVSGKNAAVYVRKIWKWPVVQIVSRCDDGAFGALFVHALDNFLYCGACAAHLLLLPYVFKKHGENERAEPEIFKLALLACGEKAENEDAGRAKKDLSFL